MSGPALIIKARGGTAPGSHRKFREGSGSGRQDTGRTSGLPSILLQRLFLALPSITSGQPAPATETGGDSGHKHQPQDYFIVRGNGPTTY